MNGIETPLRGKPKRRGLKAGIGAGLAAAALGVVGVLALGGCSSEGESASSEPTDQPSDRGLTNDGGQVDGQQAPLPAPGTQLPNAQDTATLIDQIFAKINYGYRSGDVAYVNDAVLPDRAKGLTGVQTVLGQYFASDIEGDAVDARVYATTFDEKDPDGPARLDVKVLLADTSDPVVRKVLLEVIKVDTLGDGEKPYPAHYWVAYTAKDSQLGGEFLSGSQELDSKSEADRIIQLPDTLKNWKIGS